MKAKEYSIRHNPVGKKIIISWMPEKGLEHVIAVEEKCLYQSNLTEGLLLEAGYVKVES